VGTSLKIVQKKRTNVVDPAQTGARSVELAPWKPFVFSGLAQLASFTMAHPAWFGGMKDF